MYRKVDPHIEDNDTKLQTASSCDKGRKVTICRDAYITYSEIIVPGWRSCLSSTPMRAERQDVPAPSTGEVLSPRIGIWAKDGLLHSTRLHTMRRVQLMVQFSRGREELSSLARAIRSRPREGKREREGEKDEQVGR